MLVARTEGPSRGVPSGRDGAGGLPALAVLGIAAQTLMNGSLEPILAASSAVLRRMPVGPSAPVCPLVPAHGPDETFSALIVDPHAAENVDLETGTMIMPDRIARTRSLRSAAPEPGPLSRSMLRRPPRAPRPLRRTAARGVMGNEAAFVLRFPPATVASKCQVLHSRRWSRSPWRRWSCRSPHAGAAVPVAASRPVPP